MDSNRMETVKRVTSAITGAPSHIAIRGARKIDARGVREHFWLTSADGVITATGADGEEFEHACRSIAIDPADDTRIIDAAGRLLTPGYVDIHAHGSWERSFDDGPEGIDIARAGHAVHGTTRQVCSLITNPIDVMCENLRNVRAAMDRRPDVLGSHLEGPFLALARKGAHDPECLKDPVPELVEQLLDAADGSLRQITIAPELPHGIDAIGRFAAAGVVPAVGHCDADYDMAKRGFDAGAGIITHMFNAMNGLHHREPGPIPAAVEDPRVTIEIINDGFHVQDPMVRLGFGFAPHRTAFITDAMAATDCPDGPYKLGALDVNVVDGHARLVSNGAIAGSTLLLEVAVRRAVAVLGISPVDAVEAATLTPARTFGYDRPNPVTGAPLGLLAPGYAADLLLTDPATWTVGEVWCAGRKLR
ncbi:N-acetylglucosamine-6-phosphate deacetylase [Bifidobacterium pullorum subsp. saeculare]|uniref:N-acetylglucosamine-6-phosphate deacetylase n=1 Tax=Bifidobacterium pullorum TaxID=78448 RepID=UPI00195EA741|nr:N-acetylglucosamine-6-phosphate deacetylase [Bifidobacterium pullorum]MBM6706459.1 N-acetylglucosamine-6-phosphate deacetylase [Bifidobacterium pullorum subsp. saeculare]